MDRLQYVTDIDKLDDGHSTEERHGIIVCMILKYRLPEHDMLFKTRILLQYSYYDKNILFGLVWVNTMQAENLRGSQCIELVFVFG